MDLIFSHGNWPFLFTFMFHETGDILLNTRATLETAVSPVS